MLYPFGKIAKEKKIAFPEKLLYVNGQKMQVYEIWVWIPWHCGWTMVSIWANHKNVRLKTYNMFMGHIIWQTLSWLKQFHANIFPGCKHHVILQMQNINLSEFICWSASYKQKGLSMVVHSFMNSIDPPGSAEMSHIASSLWGSCGQPWWKEWLWLQKLTLITFSI